MALQIHVVSIPSSTLHLYDDNCCCRPSFSSSPKNVRSAICVTFGGFSSFGTYSIFSFSNRTNVSFA
jgi:hypothetical protein